MKNFRKHFLGALVFLGTIMFGIIGYATWTNLTTVQPTDKLSDARWNELINQVNTLGNTVDSLQTTMSTLQNITPQAVMAFYLSSCPTGWKAADGTNSTPDLRGAFIRGINGNLNSRDVARTLGSYQADDFKSHSHNIIGINSSGNGSAAYDPPYSGLIPGTIATTSNGGTETRPKNVALIYCIKE